MGATLSSLPASVKARSALTLNVEREATARVHSKFTSGLLLVATPVSALLLPTAAMTRPVASVFSSRTLTLSILYEGALIPEKSIVSVEAWMPIRPVCDVRRNRPTS